MNPDPADDTDRELPIADEVSAGGEVPHHEPDADDIPVVLPVRSRRRPVAQPHLGWAILWNFGFIAILFGTIIGIVLIATVVLVVSGDERLKSAPASDTEIPRPLADVVAISFPIAYLAGLLFALLALRVVVGRGWTRQIGLRRPPPLHVFLVVVGLPGFVIMSDMIARLLIAIFGSTSGMNQQQMLRDMFLPFPWWFAVLAIGVGPGVVEELWCRGFLGRGLVGRHGWVLGIALTSLFFGMLHLFPPWYVLVTATMGVGLHLVYVASRSLWVPIVLHTLNNGLSALAAIGVLQGERLDQNAAASPALVGLLAGGLLVFVGAAMSTGRIRVVPIDPNLPAWEPPFPGVAHPPPGSNARLLAGKTSRTAVTLAVVSSAALVYVLLR
jgi:membrane protease YdiL (CAAX protease family)